MTFASVYTLLGLRTISAEVGEMAQRLVAIEVLDMSALTADRSTTNDGGKGGSAITTPEGGHLKGPADKVSATVPSFEGSFSLALQTMKDAWTYCKATRKTVARYHWVPALGAVTAVIAAVTATTIFANLTEGTVSTAGRAAVGAVAVISAIVTGLQAWANTRLKDLNAQHGKFHELHRKIESELDDGSTAPTKEMVEGWEKDMANVMAGMSEPSNTAWNRAREEVRKDLHQTAVWRRHFER